jgi:hypothetical protein
VGEAATEKSGTRLRAFIDKLLTKHHKPSVENMSATGHEPKWHHAALCPFYPSKRTFLSALSMSALCQKQTWALGPAHFEGGLLIDLLADWVRRFSHEQGCPQGY